MAQSKAALNETIKGLRHAGTAAMMQSQPMVRLAKALAGPRNLSSRGDPVVLWVPAQADTGDVA